MSRTRFQRHRDASCHKVFFFVQGKAPKEIHAILTETLACFLPGRAKDLSAPLYNEGMDGIKKKLAASSMLHETKIAYYAFDVIRFFVPYAARLKLLGFYFFLFFFVYIVSRETLKFLHWMNCVRGRVAR